MGAAAGVTHLAGNLGEFKKRLEKERTENERQEQAEEAQKTENLQERSKRAERVGKAFLKHAQELRRESDTAVYVNVSGHEREPTGFVLDIGRPNRGPRRRISAFIGDDGQWHIQISGPEGDRKEQTFSDDPALEERIDEVIRPLFEKAMRALIVHESDQAGER